MIPGHTFNTGDPVLDQACAFAAQFEGCVLHPYQDGGGVWTIGWGATYNPDTGQRITALTPPINQETADEWFADQMGSALDSVRHLVKVHLNTDQEAALADFVYECGAGAFAESTLLEMINKGDPAQDCVKQFARWVHDRKGDVDPGMVRRRAAEAALYYDPQAVS